MLFSAYDRKRALVVSKRKREKDYQCSGGNSRGRRLVAQALDALHVAPSYDLAIMRGIDDASPTYVTALACFINRFLLNVSKQNLYYR